MGFPKWDFRRMGPGEINVDPVHDEFFKAQDLSDALVREVIQNSLDARRGNSKVRVRFRFADGNDRLPAERAAAYLHGLAPHLASLENDLPEGLPPLDEPMPFLVIEDAGTRGLSGRPDVDPELEPEDAGKNDFYFFWRNIGRTLKGELDRGRWGLGKAVFPIASQIHTILGLTHRADDNRRLLLGQSVLKTHVRASERYSPYGFFALHDERGFPLPIEDPELIARFCEDFGLQREEPGLSVVIPWFRQGDIPFASIAAAVVRQYFYPVIRGDLVVQVENGTRSETIDGRSIEAVAARTIDSEAEEIAKLCTLTRWAVTSGAAEIEEIELQDPTRAPKWDAEIVGAQRVERLRERLERGDRIAVRVPVAVKRLRSRPAHAHFDVFMEKDESLRRGEHHFIRRGITIPEIRTPREKPVRALLVVDDDKLSTLLGDAENPAHSDWSERADRVRAHYDHGATTVRFVKTALGHLASILLRPPEGRVRDFLGDFFSIELPHDGDAPAPGRKPASEGETVADGSTPAATGGSALELRRISGGFVIEGQAPREGARMRAELAYRTPNGNPFRKHDPLDFDLSGADVTLEVEGARILSRAENVVELETESETFRVTCGGFDSRRDLVVRVTEVES